MTHSPSEIKWLDAPEAHDYPAAKDFLGLLAIPDEAVDQVIEALENVDPVKKKAKDILRASELHILPADDPHVARDLKKIEKGEPLSPVLLIRADKLVIADGYHRVCAAYHHDTDALVPAKLI